MTAETAIDPAALRQAIRAQALAEGFDAVGFAPADLAPEAGQRLDQYLAEGRHGDMGWLEATADRRRHPQALWPEARTVVVLAANYGPEVDPLAVLDHEDRGAISVYAQGRDYHDVLKKRLKALGRWLGQSYGLELKVFVDTAPVMEKPLAERAGVGWQGKHSNVVSRGFGSWLFLAEIFLPVELPADEPEGDHCGTCRRCLDACPTAAFPAPYQLDATRCISYLTIEHKGQIPLEFRRPMGNRIYGCDDCLAVCPWNKFAKRAELEPLHGRSDLQAPYLAELARLDDPGFRRTFSGSPIKRLGRDRFVRNVLVAVGNSGRAELAPVAAGLLDDPHWLVRGMAVWALGELDQPQLAALAPGHCARESAPAVLAEWDTALKQAPLDLNPSIGGILLDSL